jgi:methionine synthase I (cobalamin-dependent)
MPPSKPDPAGPGCTRYERLLAERGVLVADGAMGTTLFALGLEGGGSPELLNVEQPDLVRTVHRAFVDAGVDLILTNTFGGNRRRLALHGLEQRVHELNSAAVGLAREVADTAAREVVVAASVGPTGDLFRPLGPLTHREGVEVFREQMTAVAEAGADVIWIETLSSFEELEAAAEAAASVRLPVSATLSFDTNGRTMMGITAGRFAEWWEGTGRSLASFGANCGIGPGDGVAAVFDISATAPEAVPVTKANCGLPLYQSDRLVYPIGPEGMAAYADLAIRSGARVVGTCCGSTPEHSSALRAAVDAFAGGPRPDRAEIEERLEASPVPVAAAPRRTGRRHR